MVLFRSTESFQDVHLAVASFAFRDVHTPRNQLDEQIQRRRFRSRNPVDTISVLGLDAAISHNCECGGGLANSSWAEDCKSRARIGVKTVDIVLYPCVPSEQNFGPGWER